MGAVNIDCYLIIKATIAANGNYTACTPSVRVAKNKPRVEANEVAIKVNIDLPVSLFKRPQIMANISIPEELSPPEISAEVQDNIAQAIREASGMDVRLIVDSAGGGE